MGLKPVTSYESRVTALCTTEDADKVPEFLREGRRGGKQRRTKPDNMCVKPNLLPADKMTVWGDRHKQVRGTEERFVCWRSKTKPEACPRECLISGCEGTQTKGEYTLR